MRGEVYEIREARMLHGQAFRPQCPQRGLMADSTTWWLLAGTAVAVELVTGTFYLLMLGIGLAAGALAAHAGASLNVQLLIATVIGAGTVGAWHWIRTRRPPELPANANPDVNLDIGET